MHLHVCFSVGSSQENGESYMRECKCIEVIEMYMKIPIQHCWTSLHSTLELFVFGLRELIKFWGFLKPFLSHLYHADINADLQQYTPFILSRKWQLLCRSSSYSVLIWQDPSFSVFP